MNFFFQPNNWSYIKKYPGSSNFIMGVNGTLDFEAQKSASIHHESNTYDSRGLIKAFWSESMRFCKKNIFVIF